MKKFWSIGKTAYSMSEVFHLMDQTIKKLKQIQRRTLSEVGLTPPQYYLLTLLEEKEDRTFKELAGFLNCTQATLTGIVDTLTKNGFAFRIPNPSDRRSLLVKRTKKGKAVLKKTPDLNRQFNVCCIGLQQDEFTQLGNLLAKFNNSLSYEEEDRL